MARPSKSVDTIKKNLTKEELKQRRNSELSNLSGIPIRKFLEVEQDEIASLEFDRVIEILNAVNKNDALYEAVINDYCIYKSDIDRYAKYRANAESDLIEVSENKELDFVERLNYKDKLYRSIASYDKHIQSYQKKRFDIEKETGFTVASALRSIPKKVEKAKNPLEDIFNDDKQ